MRQIMAITWFITWLSTDTLRVWKFYIRFFLAVTDNLWFFIRTCFNVFPHKAISAANLLSAVKGHRLKSFNFIILINNRGESRKRNISYRSLQSWPFVVVGISLRLWYYDTLFIHWSHIFKFRHKENLYSRTEIRNCAIVENDDPSPILARGKLNWPVRRLLGLKKLLLNVT